MSPLRESLCDSWKYMETQNAIILSLRDSAKLQKWRSILVIARLDEIKSWQSIVLLKSLDSADSIRRNSTKISSLIKSHFFAKRAAPPPRSPTHKKAPLFLLRFARKPSAHF